MKIVSFLNELTFTYLPLLWNVCVYLLLNTLLNRPVKRIFEKNNNLKTSIFQSNLILKCINSVQNIKSHRHLNNSNNFLLMIELSIIVLRGVVIVTA